MKMQKISLSIIGLFAVGVCLSIQTRAQWAEEEYDRMVAEGVLDEGEVAIPLPQTDESWEYEDDEEEIIPDEEDEDLILDKSDMEPDVEDVAALEEKEDTAPTEAESALQPQPVVVEPPQKKDILVCQSQKCAYVTVLGGAENLVSEMRVLMKANEGKKVTLCEADASTRTCSRQGLRMTAVSPFAKIDLSMPAFTLIGTRSNKNQKLDVITAYQINANAIYPSCGTGLSEVRVTPDYKATLTSTDFMCRMTQTGQTTVNLTYEIDYINFDKGIIGAAYTWRVTGAVKGESKGYLTAQLKGVTLAWPAPKPVVVPVVEKPVVTVIAEPIPEPEPIAPVVVVTQPEPELVAEPVEPEPEVIVVPPVTTYRQEKTEDVETRYIPMKTIKTTVTERTTIVPGKGGGKAKLPASRTVLPTRGEQNQKDARDSENKLSQQQAAQTDTFYWQDIYADEDEEMIYDEADGE